MRVFEHEWETGLAPDEVNYVPGVTAARPDPPAVQRVEGRPRARRRRPCPRRSASSRRGWPGCRGCGWRRTTRSGSRPSGKALLCHQDAAYLDYLDPPNMTTCWMALDDTAADTGHDLLRARLAPLAARPAGRHVPRAGRLARRTCASQCRRTPSSSWCRSRSRPAVPPSTTAGRSTAARRTSEPTRSAARSSAT